MCILGESLEALGTICSSLEHHSLSGKITAKFHGSIATLNSFEFLKLKARTSQSWEVIWCHGESHGKKKKNIGTVNNEKLMVIGKRSPQTGDEDLVQEERGKLRTTQ